LLSGWFKGIHGRCGSGIAETDIQHTIPANLTESKFNSLHHSFFTLLSNVSSKVHPFAMGNRGAMADINCAEEVQNIIVKQQPALGLALIT